MKRLLSWRSAAAAALAATALANSLPIVTQDDDFDVLAELGLLEVIKV